MENRECQVEYYEFKRIKKGDSYNDASLFGAFPDDAEVTFILSAPRSDSVFEVKLAVAPDGGNETTFYGADFFEINGSRDMFRVTVKMDELIIKTGKGTGLFFCRWEVKSFSGTRYFGGELSKKLTEYPSPETARRQLLVFSRGFETPESFKGSVVYQIFPDRFRKSGKCGPKTGTVSKKWDDCPSFPEYPGAHHPNNDFFGGDILGIEEKLDYLSSLGVTVIYLNPIFESESNHRYDTGNMMKVDSSLGGDAAFRSLIAKAKGKGIKIILDGVFNHVGSDSVYFNRYGRYGEGGAYKSKESEYYPWFFFDEYPNSYRTWWGVEILPKVNCDELSYRDFIKDKFLKKWMDCGVSGWRIDVADELSDSFLSFLRENVKKSDPDAVLIGEVWEDASNKISYGNRREYLYGNELDGVMNYPLRDALISYMLSGNAERLRDATEGQYRRYPKQSSDVSFNILGSHDTVRILTAMGGEPCSDKTNDEKSKSRLSAMDRKLAKKKLMAAYSTICMLPGVPVIYYGDEAGCEGYGDPFCRGTFPWENEDGELLSFFREAGKERRKEPLLAKGLFEIVYLDSDVFAFLRTPENGEEYALLTVLNRSEKTVEISLNAGTFGIGPVSVLKKRITLSEAVLLTDLYG